MAMVQGHGLSAQGTQAQGNMGPHLVEHQGTNETVELTLFRGQIATPMHSCGVSLDQFDVIQGSAITS